MPRRPTRNFWWRHAWVAGLLCLASPLRLGAQGAPAPLRLYSPVDLEIVDVEATVAIASKAGERLPIVLAHDAQAGTSVAASLRDAFAATREQFLGRMEAALGARVLAVDNVAGPDFRDFRNAFQAENVLLPVSPALAQTWARGYDGEPVRERIADLLQAIERDQWIGDVRASSSAFVVTAADLRVRGWGEVGSRARPVDPESILTLTAAGELLRRTSDPLDRAAVGYLSGLLRANVAEDRYLTGLLLRERLGPGAVHRWLPRGALLAEAGQPVDHWAGLGLEQLARLGIQPLDAPVAESAGPQLETSAGDERSASMNRMRPVWIVGLVIVLLGATVLVFFLRAWRRGQQATQLAVATPAGGESMIPHLARELKDRLVRALFTQRSVLLANEQAASRRVQEMEERLARLQPAIAEKIRGYEQRIETLEKEIAERDADTRELLRAKLVLARKELDAEVARSRIDWN